ncbi:hypothetical protein CONPUDRAFT_49795, partial [Coniophora puteana RWD-64-598 SS2]
RNPKLDTHFRDQRAFADQDGQEKVFFGGMMGVLQEIDQATSCVPITKPLSFLDLGCCPGAFTTYVLKNNYRARGVGVSLPPENGGHLSGIRENYMKRFQLIYANVTFYQLGPSPIADDRRLQDLPIPLQCLGDDDGVRYSLVLLDCHHLRKQVDYVNWDYYRIVVSQLILGLSAARDGGTIVMKLSNPQRDIPAKILYLLSTLSTRLVLHKPARMHANRGTFYAVAKGVGRGAEGSRLGEIVGELRSLWVELTYGGTEGTGRWMTSEDLNFIIKSEDLVDVFADRLIKLARSVWATQLEGLKRLLAKNEHTSVTEEKAESEHL